MTNGDYITKIAEQGEDFCIFRDDVAGTVTIEVSLDWWNKPKTGYWIEDAETYYKAINEKGGGVNENTPYFTDDIACSECLAKFSVIDNETQRFKCCPNCGAKMVEPQEGGDQE